MDQRPEQPPEGRLIADAASRLDLSIREAARRAGISYGRWRQIVMGYQNISPGVYAPVHAPARTVAKMARVVGVTPAQLASAGREDAARTLEEILHSTQEPARPAPSRDDQWTPPLSEEELAATWPYFARITENIRLWTARYAQEHPDTAPEDIPPPPGEALFGPGSPDAANWDRRIGLFTAHQLTWLIAAAQLGDAARDRENTG